MLKTSAQKALIFMLAFAIVSGGFLCMLSAGGMGTHMASDSAAAVATHVSFANTLNRALSPVILAIAAAFVFLIVVLSFFISHLAVLAVSVSAASRYRYRRTEPRASEQSVYSWLTLLVRSPGSFTPA